VQLAVADPYLPDAACALKLGARGETYDTDPHNRAKELFVAGLAPGAITTRRDPHD
jgi:hypothetical protein